MGSIHHSATFSRDRAWNKTAQFDTFWVLLLTIDKPSWVDCILLSSLHLPMSSPTGHLKIYACALLPDITGRTALAVQPDVVNAKYHVITNATYNRDPVPAKFKHVTNIDTCTLLCCDYNTLWEALHVNMVEIGARFSDENVKILVSYQWIGWKRRTKMVGE